MSNPFEILANAQGYGSTAPVQTTASAASTKGEPRVPVPTSMPQTSEKLTGKQIIVLVDISKEMKTSDITKAGVDFKRIEVVKQQIGSLVEELTVFDKDGIDLITISKTPTHHPSIKTAAKVEELMDSITPSGYANINDALKKAFELHKGYKKREGHQSTIVLVLSAAEATSSHWFTSAKKELKKTLIDITERVKEHHELGILFVQVGNSKSKKKFLEELDEMDGLKNDIITEVNFSKLGYKLEAQDLVAKALVGS